MAKIHTILQGKGGVGKSVAAAFLAQFKIEKGEHPLCIDTDPVNLTFHGYKGLPVQCVKIMEADEINPRSFDTLVEMIAVAKDDVVIDNGASSFVPLSHFLISNKVPALLKELGHDLVVHTIVTGGQAFADTISGFSQLVGQFPTEAQFVVWLNPYWGQIEHDGKGFEQMKTYNVNREKISAIERIPALKKETYGRDLSDMLQERQTFDEAIATPSRTIMTRQRLKIIKSQVFGQFENAVVL